MSLDLITLLRRDHRDADRGLLEILRPKVAPRELADALDGVRLGLTAHVIAMEIAVARTLTPSVMARLEHELSQLQVSYRAVRAKLAALICDRPYSTSWVRCARELGAHLAGLAMFEVSTLAQALRELAPELYTSLAGTFATERMRQLAMLQPSAPVHI